MKEVNLQSEASKLVKAGPIYLAIQGVVLLLTYLDTPVYLETYQKNQIMTVTGWVGVWFVLVVLGLAAGLVLLIRKQWQRIFADRERVKLALGYLLGALAGLLTLGLRFMPVMPAAYFYSLACLVVLGLAGYAFWIIRAHKADEIFS